PSLIIAVLANTARAENPPDPLRLVPEEADLLVKIESPRKLIETGLNLDAVKQLFQLEAVREFYDSTNFRLFHQLIAYYEKELALPWPEILERVAGGGVVFSAKIGPEPAPVLFIVQGTDEKFFKKFMQVTLDVVDQEQARRGIKERLVR